tara:strand:+ start:462 stop:581 length:120 start_codon:yes stop_codon:yes gene_type:complete
MKLPRRGALEKIIAPSIFEAMCLGFEQTIVAKKMVAIES